MPFITTPDRVEIFYKDWGSGQAVVLSHGWRTRTAGSGSRCSPGMQAGHRNAYDSIAAFSATDMRDDLAKFDVPTLVIHGDADQVVPFDAGGRASAALIEGAELKVYEGAPHGVTDTHKERLNADLLAFATAPASLATV
jgi:pimeloyl-ACP methyl ester carboxylesterase